MRGRRIMAGFSRIGIVLALILSLPLFVGVSVEPEVDIKSPPTGPNAGEFLQEVSQPAPAGPP